MRAGRLLGGLFVLLLATPATAASPSPSPTPEPEDPVRVEITQILPRAPHPGGAIDIAGVLRNTGSRRISGLRVRLQVGERITTRSELQQADQDRPPTGLRLSAAPVLDHLAPGQATAFTVHADTRLLGLAALGVYPLDVVARGNAGDGNDNLGLAPTWLPYFGSLSPRPTRVAVLWPLVDVPRLSPKGTLDGLALSTELGPGGRLRRLLTVARAAEVPACEAAALRPDGTPDVAPTRCEPVPVTYGIDPDLLDTTTALAASTSLAQGAARARTWLSDLRNTSLTDRLLALPYADPDVSALARDPRLKEDIANAEALGTETVRTVLQVQPLTALAWPPPGPVSTGAADELALGGANAFVLDPSAYDDNGRPDTRTPTSHALFTTTATGAELTGLVVDRDLSDLLTTSTAYGTRVTEQRFLAETAIIAAEAPGLSRTLVLAPARRGAVPLAALDELRDLGRVPWLCPVALRDVGAGTESCPGESAPPAPPANRGEPSTERGGEISASYLRAVAADRDVATQLTDAVVSASPTTRTAVAALKGRLRRAVARAESSVGRDEPTIARRNSAALHQEVAHLVGQVVVRGGRSLLTSTRGTLSVNVENTLTLPVTVRVRFTSKTATLTNAVTALVTVQPGHAVQASVKAQAQRSGQFVVFAQMIDRNGTAFGPETEIIVRSTRYGRLAVLLTAVAFGVLLVAAGLRIAQRVRGARA